MIKKFNWHPILQGYMIDHIMEKHSTMKIRKIDNRNDLFGDFVWQITMTVEEFLSIRDWCCETWGPTVEYQWWNKHGPKRNATLWSFDSRPYVKKSATAWPAIYLHSDKELALFNLKWA